MPSFSASRRGGARPGPPRGPPPPATRRWLLGLHAGTNSSNPSLSSLTTLITSAALVPKDQAPEVMSLVRTAGFHSPCPGALCSPGRRVRPTRTLQMGDSARTGAVRGDHSGPREPGTVPLCSTSLMGTHPVPHGLVGPGTQMKGLEEVPALGCGSDSCSNWRCGMERASLCRGPEKILGASGRGLGGGSELVHRGGGV